MFSILDIFYLVFSQLAVGGFVLLFLVPKGLVGANFYRLMGSIYLLVSGLSRCADLALHRQPVTFLNFFGFWQNPESVLVISFVLILLIYTLSWWFKVPLLTRLLFFGGVICGATWIVLSAQRYSEIVQLPGEMFLLPLQFLTAAVLLGAVHSGMWFGHWYLVTPLNFFGFWQNPESVLVISFVLILLIYTLSWWFKVPLLTRLLFFGGVICGAMWIVLSAQRYSEIVQLPGEMFLLPLQFLTAAVLLGAVHSGMWFGHWYLVTPDLPVIYLKRFNSVLLYTLSGMALLLCLNIFFRQQSMDVVPFNLFYQIIFSMRLFIGIAGTLLLYFITWDCLRPKSVARDVLGATRAATGFLFIAIITVFLGEFCSRFLLLEMRFIF